MGNRLEQEKSPYLLQHKDNPVDWYSWCKEAFEKANTEGKPIFLSIGYSTCHWCHVMAHESFENAEVAALLNENFVCIKVDREERPDIDAVYMMICQALTGSGGWPLTVFMTPEQKPFFAGTYFPPKTRCGQVGLIELLVEISRLWKTERAQLLEAGNQIAEAVRQADTALDGRPEKALLQKAYSFLRRSFDSIWGGFGDAPKFPIPHNLLFLLRYSEWEKSPDALQMAAATLDAMAYGGIHDQIGGGFSRYSTDEKWLIPHFEKMLYDNALLLIVYLEAFQRTKKKFYSDVARRTAEYILRELTDDSGGFYCGQDADSDGVEGKYYGFTPQEITWVLGKGDGTEFCRLYGITAHGNFEGNSIPNLLGQKAPGWNADDSRLQKLYEYRRGRVSLHKDDKILLSWNAWTAIAMARAGRILGGNRYSKAAFRAQQFIEEKMTNERNRLYLRFREGEAANAAQLDDYAVYTLMLTELYQVSFAPEYLRLAVLRARQMTEFFEDREHGGYFINSKDSEQLITRPKETYDGAIPSGNAAAAMALERLAGLTGEQFWREAADRQNLFMAGQVKANPAGHCFGLLAMAEALYAHRELICAGSCEPPELTAYLRENPANGLHVLLKTPETADLLAAVAPFTKAYPIPENGTTWYLCENGSCQTPVTSFKQLELYNPKF